MAKEDLHTTNLTAPIFSKDGKEAGVIELPAGVFDLAWNGDLVHQVVTGMQSNARFGNAHTKDRSEVRGGGKKPWKQKGTGRARHGSSRSPIWRGGGITFGPRSDKDYTKTIPKKMRVKALFVSLSQKFRDGEIIFVENFGIDAPKTKQAEAILTALTAKHEKLGKAKNAALIAAVEKTEAIKKSFSNIGRVDVQEVRNLNPVEVLGHTYLIIESPAEAVALISERKK